MGSKNLKAIAARGDLPIKAADEEKLNIVKDRIRKKIEENGIAKALHNYGSAVLVNIINENYVLPTRKLPDRTLPRCGEYFRRDDGKNDPQETQGLLCLYRAMRSGH